MQRLFSALCGLLASCLCSWGFNDSVWVIQSPSTMVLHEGDQAQIICSWNISIAHTPKVKWFKDKQKFPLNQTDKRTSNLHNSSCAVLVINHSDVADAGVYWCEVTQDIPQLRTGRGTGTDVTYVRNYDRGTTPPGSTTSPQNAERSSGAAVWTSASASAAGVLLFVCVCLSVWRRKMRHTQSERTVIREGPPSEGEEPENSADGGSSRTSRGSTQWYMVPVYESYFDLQRSDDQPSADSTEKQKYSNPS